MLPPINFLSIDRHWFLTWVTYGTWLPGDDRGFVGNARDHDGVRAPNNVLNTLPAPPNPGLRRFASESRKLAPTFLNSEQAIALLEQFQETARFRRWLLLAVAVMPAHIHVVAGVTGDPSPDKILGDFKAYGSRQLSLLANEREQTEKQHKKSWWATGGSTRKVAGEASLRNVVEYVSKQPNPLLVWTREDGVILPK